MRNGKPSIELKSVDAEGNTAMELEITIDDPDEYDRIRRKVAMVLIEEWTGLGEPTLSVTNESFTLPDNPNEAI